MLRLTGFSAERFEKITKSLDPLLLRVRVWECGCVILSPSC